MYILVSLIVFTFTYDIVFIVYISPISFQAIITLVSSFFLHMSL